MTYSALGYVTVAGTISIQTEHGGNHLNYFQNGKSSARILRGAGFFCAKNFLRTAMHYYGQTPLLTFYKKTFDTLLHICNLMY